MLWLGLISTPAYGRDGFDPDGAPFWRSHRHRGIFGMWLFVASLTMLFGASLTLHALLRAGVIGQGAPAAHTPQIMFLSTLVLLLSGATMHGAVVALRRNAPARVFGRLLATLALGCVFLVLQFVGWAQLTDAGLDATNDLGWFSFYLLTTLHAAHVVGGILALTWVTLRAGRGCYTATRPEGLWMCAIYWHFLDAVWLVLFFTLFIFG